MSHMLSGISRGLRQEPCPSCTWHACGRGEAASGPGPSSERVETWACTAIQHARNYCIALTGTQAQPVLFLLMAAYRLRTQREAPRLGWLISFTKNT